MRARYRCCHPVSTDARGHALGARRSLESVPFLPSKLAVHLGAAHLFRAASAARGGAAARAAAGRSSADPQRPSSADRQYQRCHLIYRLRVRIEAIRAVPLPTAGLQHGRPSAPSRWVCPGEARKGEVLDDALGDLAGRQKCVVDAQVVQALVELPAGIELVPCVGLEQVASGRIEVAP